MAYEPDVVGQIIRDANQAFSVRPEQGRGSGTKNGVQIPNRLGLKSHEPTAFLVPFRTAR